MPEQEEDFKSQLRFQFRSKISKFTILKKVQKWTFLIAAEEKSTPFDRPTSIKSL